MIMIVAGPCAIESEEQLAETAEFLAGLGVTHLRGGAFKPRTNPKSFQGLGLEGLKIGRRVADKYGMQLVSEILDDDIHPFVWYVDVIQIGSRNAQNYALLKKVGKLGKPVILKRGMAQSIDEWCLAARYVTDGGASVTLCERGIRTFEPQTRCTLDLAAIVLGRTAGFKVLADPSHATGRRDLVAPLAKAALAAGADGLMIEVHPTPHLALSDADQQLGFEAFRQLYEEIVRGEQHADAYVRQPVNRTRDVMDRVGWVERARRHWDACHTMTMSPPREEEP